MLRGTRGTLRGDSHRRILDVCLHEVMCIRPIGGCRIRGRHGLHVVLSRLGLRLRARARVVPGGWTGRRRWGWRSTVFGRRGGVSTHRLLHEVLGHSQTDVVQGARGSCRVGLRRGQRRYGGDRAGVG